jgi:hypothetical protein
MTEEIPKAKRGIFEKNACYQAIAIVVNRYRKPSELVNGWDA